MHSMHCICVHPCVFTYFLSILVRVQDRPVCVCRCVHPCVFTCYLGMSAIHSAMDPQRPGGGGEHTC